jgi:polyisoprenoid-binding protein YceI
MTVKKWLLIALAVVVVAVVGGPFVYIHLIEGKAPAKFSLSASSASPSASSGSVDGTWTIASGSQVGYRVHEILFGQTNEAAGRTSAVTGTVTVDGTKITAADFKVDMTQVSSDKPMRDRQFQGRIMQTSTFPTSSFVLSDPIAFRSVPPANTPQTKTATGKLTLHGVTKTVTFTLQCERTGDTAEVTGSIPITFADYSISNPSFGPVTTDDHGTLEFKLDLKHA